MPRILTAALAIATAAILWSQAARPVTPTIGKSPRYCNPLPIEATSRDGSPQGVNLGDVTIVREANRYYLFATGGGAWVSSNLVDWKYQPVEVPGARIPVAPHVAKYKGAFYLSGNSAPLYKAADVLGPYELVGPWLDEKGEPWKGLSNGHPWTGALDVDIFVDDDNKPYLYAPGRSTDGIYVMPLKGPGHGCVVQGPDGNWWQFYTIVYSNPPGGRRLGMDPVAFDANGNMIVRATETPQWAPGVVGNPARNGDSKSIPLSVHKLRNLNQLGGFSSQRLGHHAAYALDDSNGTWWEPVEDDAAPSLTIDLGSTTEWAPEQLFTVDSSRILFTARGGFGGGRGQQPAPQPPTGSTAFRYKIETSRDGKTFTTMVDKTGNSTTRYTEFDEIPPTQCRFVRLTITDWPHIANAPLGITEFTVFGHAVEK